MGFSRGRKFGKKLIRSKFFWSMVVLTIFILRLRSCKADISSKGSALLLIVIIVFIGAFTVILTAIHLVFFLIRLIMKALGKHKTAVKTRYIQVLLTFGGWNVFALLIFIVNVETDRRIESIRELSFYIVLICLMMFVVNLRHPKKFRETLENRIFSQFRKEPAEERIDKDSSFFKYLSCTMCFGWGVLLLGLAMDYPILLLVSIPVIITGILLLVKKKGAKRRNKTRKVSSMKSKKSNPIQKFKFLAYMGIIVVFISLVISLIAEPVLDKLLQSMYNRWRGPEGQLFKGYVVVRYIKKGFTICIALGGAMFAFGLVGLISSIGKHKDL